MKQRRVRFTETAQQHARREKAWWLENRIHTEVFAAEFEAAIRILTSLPGVGAAYTKADVAGLRRRLYLSKVACHLYYTFDENEVVVRALWGARRGSGPEIKS